MVQFYRTANWKPYNRLKVNGYSLFQTRRGETQDAGVWSLLRPAFETEKTKTDRNITENKRD
jgi:hypothetical protein